MSIELGRISGKQETVRVTGGKLADIVVNEKKR
jgi:hypothetical protein